MARDFVETADKISAQIPDTEAWGDLHYQIKRVVRDAGFTPPELRARDWLHLCVVLERHLPYPPEAPWQERVLEIIRDEEKPS